MTSLRLNRVIRAGEFAEIFGLRSSSNEMRFLEVWKGFWNGKFWISTLVASYGSDGNCVNIWWVVKFPASRDVEERQLRHRSSILHVSVLLHNTNKSKDDSMDSRYDGSCGGRFARGSGGDDLRRTQSLFQ
ncbi:hypothetical protein F2Q70_00031914 [Brassica cretica]|uniref:Uncharacterized protein n=1 Tax=Brassica cretica TaxID=69181 RepID=A0A8S9FHA3_BRACR|nr:hypothetical protein F2Q70_00031914 [Brassica cretica]